VFLRLLDSFNGILFLSTNRIATFDEAFASRINLSLYYPSLTIDAAVKVLQLSLARIQTLLGFEDRRCIIYVESILDFARRYWAGQRNTRYNGRQIHNACRAALALARSEAQGGSYTRVSSPSAAVKLTERHFAVVFQAYTEFINYLREHSDGGVEDAVSETREDSREDSSLGQQPT
jgi:SpoVK/Ycf46/Vps4 family AAA+-type ATPase